MFEDRSACSVDAAPPGIGGWLRELAELPRDVSDAERVDRIRALEDLKAAAAAAQARAAADLDASVRAQHRAQGLPADQQGRGVASQVALARRDSPVAGGRHLGLAKALVHEMPHTLAALTAGWLSEWRATLLVRETACLSREDRGRVDAELLADPAVLTGLGDRSVAGAARRVAYRLDPHAALARSRKAEQDRRVTLRPAPDTMANLGGLLPVAQGVAAFAELGREADRARAAGDPRTRGQLMADTLFERITGRAAATGPDVSVGLVMTERTLLTGDNEPAVVPGYGPVPAPWARHLVRRAEAGAFVRRLFTHPDSGELVATESRSRCFPPALRDLIVARDQVCRTPWCDAPVRHADHAVDHAAGGATDAANGQGLCEHCNYAKTAPDWRARPSPDNAPGSHAITTTTPTGHAYTSRPPPLPGHAAAQAPRHAPGQVPRRAPGQAPAA